MHRKGFFIADLINFMRIGYLVQILDSIKTIHTLNIPIRFTYRKTEKLKSRKQIQILFKEGKALQVGNLRVVYQFSNSEQKLQAAVTVGSRHFKRAVDRNRIKRLMREAYRFRKHLLLEKLQHKQQSILLFFTFTGRDIPDFEQVQKGMESVIKKLILLIDATV